MMTKKRAYFEPSSMENKATFIATAVCIAVVYLFGAYLGQLESNHIKEQGADKAYRDGFINSCVADNKKLYQCETAFSKLGWRNYDAK